MLLVQFFITFNKHFWIFCRSTVAGSAGLTHHLRAGSAFQFVKDIIEAFKFWLNLDWVNKVDMFLNIKQRSLFENRKQIPGLLFKFCRHCRKFITFQLTLNLYKQWKIRRVVCKNLPLGGPVGNQILLRGTAWRKVWLPVGPLVGKFSWQTLRTFHCFSDFLIKIVKFLRPRVALGLTLNKPVLPNGSLTVLKPDFTGVIWQSDIS